MGARLTNENLVFKTTSNHREVQYIDDREVQLDQVITSALPKLPLDISIRGKTSFLVWKKNVNGFLCSSLAWN